jgi:MFS family permease
MPHLGDAPAGRAGLREVDGGRVLRTVSWRLLPLLVVLYVVSFVDRVNIGVAALRMIGGLGLSPAAYGLASGIFFLGYVAFQAPSNMALHRVGARRWIAVLLVAWGLASTATAFVWSAHSLYAMRLALGAAEAGFFPGVICYLARWFLVGSGPMRWRPSYWRSRWPTSSGPRSPGCWCSTPTSSDSRGGG